MRRQYTLLKLFTEQHYTHTLISVLLRTKGLVWWVKVINASCSTAVATLANVGQGDMEESRGNQSGNTSTKGKQEQEILNQISRYWVNLKWSQIHNELFLTGLKFIFKRISNINNYTAILMTELILGSTFLIHSQVEVEELGAECQHCSVSRIQRQHTNYRHHSPRAWAPT